MFFMFIIYKILLKLGYNKIILLEILISVFFYLCRVAIRQLLDQDGMGFAV